MVSPFEMVILRLRELGFFEFLLPFMLSSAIFYGLLRKSQVFGEPDKNVAVNAIVSLMISFMIWAYPVIAGVHIEKQLSAFFMQGLIGTVVVLFGVMISGFVFQEGLAKALSDKVKGGSVYIFIIVAGILGGATLLVTSGLFSVFFPQGVSGIGGLTTDVFLSVAVMVIMVVSMIAIVAATGMGGGKKEEPEKKP